MLTKKKPVWTIELVFCHRSGVRHPKLIRRWENFAKMVKIREKETFSQDSVSQSDNRKFSKTGEIQSSNERILQKGNSLSSTGVSKPGENSENEKISQVLGSWTGDDGLSKARKKILLLKILKLWYIVRSLKILKSRGKPEKQQRTLKSWGTDQVIRCHSSI